MTDKAIAKITEEAMAENNSAVTKIEEHLTSLCTGNAVAEKLLSDKKSLKECYQKIREYARTKMTNGCAVLEDEEVYKMAEEYYGITGSDIQQKPEKRKAVNVLDFL